MKAIFQAVKYWWKHGFEKYPSYRESETWSIENKWFIGEYTPFKDTDYSKVREYAQQRYDEVRQIQATIDSRTEWCFGLAAASAGAIFGFSGKIGLGIGWAIPAGAVFILSMYHSLRARMPGNSATPFSGRDAIERFENTTSLDAWVAASLHCATTGLEVIHTWKAKQLKFAGHSMIVGLVVLALCISIAKVSQSDRPLPTTADHTLQLKSSLRIEGEAPVSLVP